MSLKYNDLQPWVEMLCDAIENKGASSSGYDHGAYACAEWYRLLLERVRDVEEEVLPEDVLFCYLRAIKWMMFKSTDRQQYRLNSIADALDTYIMKEYYARVAERYTH